MEQPETFTPDNRAARDHMLRFGNSHGEDALPNDIFEIRGINHLALVCKDMARTVDFYTNVLGMPLIKTIDLPGGMGQHFFFDIGNGDALAFFWFPDAPAAQPGIASAASLPGAGSIYFFDPDGICLEFAAWTRALDPGRDATHAPRNATGQKREPAPA
jgi:hypothetical protein